LAKILFSGLGIFCILLLFSGCLDFETPVEYVVEGEWEAETATGYQNIWISFEEVENWSNTGEIHFSGIDEKFDLSDWKWEPLTEELTGSFMFSTNNSSRTWEFSGEFQNMDELYIRFYSSSGLMVDGFFHRQ